MSSFSDQVEDLLATLSLLNPGMADECRRGGAGLARLTELIESETDAKNEHEAWLAAEGVDPDEDDYLYP